ncbi:MAG: hypothetical protein AAGH88_12765 [Planctomycetota bacterium]
MSDRFLRGLFYLAQRHPRLLSRLAPGLAWGTWRLARGVRAGVRDNLAHLLPTQTSDKERDRIGRRVLLQFIRFVADLGHAQHASFEALLARAVTIEGKSHYRQARSLGKGAVIATAHLGSFEVGLAVTADMERATHVVFATDPFPRFDQLRTSLREKLGVQEARADQGWAMWGDLRDALARDEVVVMQADRVMPGQKGMSVPLLGAPAELPTGPVRLAQLTGSPILPVFAVREPDGHTIRIMIEKPIMVPDTGDPRQDQSAAIVALSEAIGRVVGRYPDQWLMLHRVWVEG